MDILDVTEEYYRNAKPRKGGIAHDDNSAEPDRRVSELLYSIFGGNIRTLEPELVNMQNVKTPDAIWNGMFWEYKSISSKISIEKRIRIAWHQLRENAERKGTQDDRVGILIDITERKVSQAEIVEYTCMVFKRKVSVHADLIIIENERVVKIIRK